MDLNGGPKNSCELLKSHLSMERLRSAHRYRETYVGRWLPEPTFTGPQAVVVLEMLSSLERAVFVAPMVNWPNWLKPSLQGDPAASRQEVTSAPPKRNRKRRHDPGWAQCPWRSLVWEGNSSVNYQYPGWLTTLIGYRRAGTDVLSAGESSPSKRQHMHERHNYGSDDQPNHRRHRGVDQPGQHGTDGLARTANLLLCVVN